MQHQALEAESKPPPNTSHLENLLRQQADLDARDRGGRDPDSTPKAHRMLFAMTLWEQTAALSTPSKPPPMRMR
jgi:hypothetical protein